MRRLALLLMLSGCVESIDLENKVFPCRSPSDCVAGHYCEPVRFVCVPIGADARVVPDRVDAGARDASND